MAGGLEARFMFKGVLFVLVVLSSFLPSSLFAAQSNYAVLGGTIYDPQQRAILGADVVLTSVSTRAERHVTTNDQGIFQITGLLPGEYEVTIQASGFAPWSRTLPLEVGQQASLDLNLTIASVADVVQVFAQPADVLRTADASVGE